MKWLKAAWLRVLDVEPIRAMLGSRLALLFVKLHLVAWPYVNIPLVRRQQERPWLESLAVSRVNHEVFGG